MIREIAIGRELILDILRGLNNDRQIRVEGIPDEAKCIGAVYDSPRKAILLRVDVDADPSAAQEIDVTVVESPVVPEKMFIVGKRVGELEHKGWEFIGCFATEPEAVAACTTDMMFVGPTAVGERWPDETIEWPGAYYPLLESPPIADEVPLVSSTTEDVDE